MDPYQHPQLSKLKLIQNLDLDVDTAPLSDDPVPMEERFTGEEYSKVDDEGNRFVRLGTGKSWTWTCGKGFKNVEQVLGFDPSSIKYDSYAGNLSLSVEELAEEYDREHEEVQRLVSKRCLVPAGS